MKECSRCKETKSIEAFGKCNSRKDGLQIQCKQCKVEQNRLKGYTKKHYLNNPDKAKRSIQQSIQWVKDNKEKHSQYVKNYINNNKEAWLKMNEDYINRVPAGVYGIKCLINGKMYIGESKYPLKRRGHHFSLAKSEKTLSSTNLSLQKDLQKYGKGNFIFGIIEETPNHKQRETYWINYYQPEYND